MRSQQNGLMYLLESVFKMIEHELEVMRQNAEYMSRVLTRVPMPLHHWADIPFEEPRTYGLIRGSDISIGRSFDPIDLLSIKGTAIDFEVERTGGAETSFEYYYISDKTSISSIVKTDSTASMGYLGSSFAFGDSNFTQQENKLNTLQFLAIAKTDYGTWSLKPGYKLFPEAEELLIDDADEFAKRYGTRYVASERRMDAVVVLMQIASSSSLVKRKFESTLDGVLGFGKLTSGFKNEFSKEVTAASKQERLIFESFSIGGTGTSGLGNLLSAAIGSPDSYKAISECLVAFLSEFEETKAKPYEMNVAPMSNFGLDDSVGIPWTRDRAKKLVELKNLLERLKFEIELGVAIATGTHPLSKIIGENLKKDLDRSISKIEALTEEATNLYMNCRTNPDLKSFEKSIPVEMHLPLNIHLYSLNPSPHFSGIAIAKNKTVGTLSLPQIAQCLELPPSKRLDFVKEVFPLAEHAQFSVGTKNHMPLESYVVEIKTRINNRPNNPIIFASGDPNNGFFDLWHSSNENPNSLERKLVTTVKGCRLAFSYEFEVLLRLTDAANRTFTHRISRIFLVGGANRILQSKYEYYPTERPALNLDWHNHP